MCQRKESKMGWIYAAFYQKARLTQSQFEQGIYSFKCMLLKEPWCLLCLWNLLPTPHLWWLLFRKPQEDGRGVSFARLGHWVVAWQVSLCQQFLFREDTLGVLWIPLETLFQAFPGSGWRWLVGAWLCLLPDCG